MLALDSGVLGWTSPSFGITHLFTQPWVAHHLRFSMDLLLNNLGSMLRMILPSLIWLIGYEIVNSCLN